MNCPDCSTVMKDCRFNKTNPKYPDFKCPSCQKAVWLKKKSTGNYQPKTGNNNYGKQDYGNGVPKSMYGAWAANFVIALVEKGSVKTTDDIVKAYAYFVQQVGLILNAPQKPVAPKPVSKPAPKPMQPQEEEAIQDETGGENPEDLENLDIDLGELQL